MAPKVQGGRLNIEGLTALAYAKHPDGPVPAAAARRIIQQLRVGELTPQVLLDYIKETIS